MSDCEMDMVEARMDCEYINGLEAELSRLREENRKLKGWQDLFEASPEGARAIVAARSIASRIMQPHTEAWKKEVEQAEERGAREMHRLMWAEFTKTNFGCALPEEEALQFWRESRANK